MKTLLFLTFFFLTFSLSLAFFHNNNNEAGASISDQSANSAPTALEIAERNAAILKNTKAEIDEINKLATYKNDLVNLAVAGNTWAQRMIRDQAGLERNRVENDFDTTNGKQLNEINDSNSSLLASSRYRNQLDEEKRRELYDNPRNSYHDSRRITIDSFNPPINDSYSSNGLVNNRTGEFYAPAGSGYTGTRDGTYYAPSGPNGVIDTKTGRFIPVN